MTAAWLRANVTGADCAVGTTTPAPTTTTSSPSTSDCSKGADWTDPVRIVLLIALLALAVCAVFFGYLALTFRKALQEGSYLTRSEALSEKLLSPDDI